MILGNRLYERKEPERDAALCIIYCEGRKRDPQVLYGSTEMFKLGKTLYPMVATAIERARQISSL